MAGFKKDLDEEVSKRKKKKAKTIAIKKSP